MELDSLVENFVLSVNGNYRSLNQLMTKCLELIPIKLPDVVMNAKLIAQSHWFGRETSKEDLERARINCWEYLDENSAVNGISERAAYATRAVICTLYCEPPSDDLGELAEFFVQMLIAASSNDEIVIREKILEAVTTFRMNNE